jgi:putative ATP-dependent endonuclease of OLD family
MRLSRIQIRNFRNFAHLDVVLGKHTVVVGENKIGKSNLVYALRLLLDPALPDSARYLRLEDFWDGLPRPLTRNDTIEISVDFTDFEDKEELVALLAEYLIEVEPMTSRLTYRYQPLGNLQAEPSAESDYEFVIYGGDRPDALVPLWTRRRIPLVVFEALRDAEGDLERWRRSPLRPLLEAAAGKIGADELQRIVSEVQKATATLSGQAEIKALANLISSRLDSMVGQSNSMDLTLGLSPTRGDRLIRALRLFIDGGARDIADASLGSANLLYLALKTLELQQLVDERRLDYVMLAIEEPEAHLHPHLQRLAFRDFLRTRTSGVSTKENGENGSRLVILTTHSPHVVSVTPLHSLVILKRSAGGHTVGVSTARLQLNDQEVSDLERYLDVTRGEIFFAKGALLVEGMAEEFIVPRFGELLGYDFDQLGITVCSVGGTNFEPYAKLLGTHGLEIPHAVMTDLDPVQGGVSLGTGRITRLLGVTLGEPTVRESINANGLEGLAQKSGVFLNSHTLEVDLWRANAVQPFCDTLAELAESHSAAERATSWRARPAEVSLDELLADVGRIGKGRFAQRLAPRLRREHCPEYIEQAIQYVVDSVR